MAVHHSKVKDGFNLFIFNRLGIWNIIVISRVPVCVIILPIGVFKLSLSIRLSHGEEEERLLQMDKAQL